MFNIKSYLEKRRKARAHKAVAARLYEAAVRAGRDPALYRDMGVADTLDGRFDAIVLHLALILRRMKAPDVRANPLGRALASAYVQDLDRSLREMGVGDLSVGKQVKRMIQAFYGRLKAYDEALAAGDSTDTALRQALIRNLYRNEAPEDAALSAMVAHVRRRDAALNGHEPEDMPLAWDQK